MRTAFERTCVAASALAAMAAFSGCYVRARTRTETTPVRATVTVNAPDTTVVAPPPTTSGTAGAGIVIVTPSCSPGAGEACNGLDDNCDGRIDEGCGWASGQIQVTLSWNSGADMDLYVYDPSGYQIYYGDRASPSGGMLDHDARGMCTGNGTIENVYWSSPRPPSGNYTVEVHYWGDCGDRAAIPTPVQVSISVGGAIIGVYQATLYPDQRTTIATFPVY